MDLALLLPCFMNLVFYLFVWFHFFCTAVSLVFYVSLNRLYFDFFNLYTYLEDRHSIFNSTNGCLLLYDIHNSIWVFLILKDKHKGITFVVLGA